MCSHQSTNSTLLSWAFLKLLRSVVSKRNRSFCKAGDCAFLLPTWRRVDLFRSFWPSRGIRKRICRTSSDDSGTSNSLCAVYRRSPRDIFSVFPWTFRPRKNWSALQEGPPKKRIKNFVYYFYGCEPPRTKNTLAHGYVNYNFAFCLPFTFPVTYKKPTAPVKLHEKHSLT